MSLSRIETLRCLPGILPPTSITEQTAQPLHIPRGAITQIYGKRGSGRLKLLLQHLDETAPTQPLVWIERKLTFYPPALRDFGIDFSRWLIIETQDELVWTLDELLSSQAFPILLVSADSFQLTDPRGDRLEVLLRRFQILAKRSNTALVWISETPCPTHAQWPIALQIEVSQRQAFTRRNRGAHARSLVPFSASAG